MNPVVLTVAGIAAIGLLLLLLAARLRFKRGFTSGETEALDNVTLISERHGLVGRPDRIVKQGSTYVPEEWKSSRRISHGHRLQLATYFLLIEECYGTRPKFGFVVLGDGSRVKVANTEALRGQVLSIASQIRERRHKLADPVLVSQPPGKCRNCGQRANCAQASG